MSGSVIGFVGIGRMGAHMAARLRAAGHKLCIFDTNAMAVAELERNGASVAASAQDVGDHADTVFISLPTPDIVHSVVLGENGISRGSRVKTVIDLPIAELAFRACDDCSSRLGG